MAAIPYFIISPTLILSLLSLFKKKPVNSQARPIEYTLDILIPTYDEESNICMCLNSIYEQSVSVNKIWLIDDNSQDRTLKFAGDFAKVLGLPLHMIRRKNQQGKTASLHQICQQSDADIIFVLDSDTVLTSKNYIEKLLQGFNTNKVASVCGQVKPFTAKQNRFILSSNQHLLDFARLYPESVLQNTLSTFHKCLRGITNVYRYCLYSFLQKVIYPGQIRLCGTMINPIGCAVAYNRKLLLQVFQQYTPKMGHNLTTSEDIFIGFAFCHKGYQNRLVKDVDCHTQEPKVTRLPKQVLLWSSSFFQSCYYFSDLVLSPFKLFKLGRKKSELSKANFTQKYGRSIGWFIFSGLVEKVVYPATLIVLLILGQWFALIITIFVETLITGYLISVIAPAKRKLKDGFLSIMITPVRYFLLLFEWVVLTKFVCDILFKRELSWRK